LFIVIYNICFIWRSKFTWLFSDNHEDS